ncbi:MAG: hypothetical protein ACE3L7_26440 [Candidatus Pristimantibacillus sp.]
MVHAFIIEPDTYTDFENEDELIDKCREWSLLSEKATKSKAFFYKRNGMSLACSIVGYVDQMTAVIQFDNQNKHCIHPSFLKEMQAANYGQKISALEEQPLAAADAASEDAEEIQVKEPKAVKAANADNKPKSEQPKAKAKKEKAPKLELPEGKVKMKAIVKEFTTVPNHFSDEDDEVIIYEEVAIIESEIVEIGAAWSSHSATLKKLELEVGDVIQFDGKIVAKKLTRHPVPYKINNPAKIQKD